MRDFIKKNCATRTAAFLLVAWQKKRFLYTGVERCAKDNHESSFKGLEMPVKISGVHINYDTITVLCSCHIKQTDDSRDPVRSSFPSAVLRMRAFSLVIQLAKFDARFLII